MNEILEPLAPVVPPKYAGMLALLLVLSQVIGRIYQAIRLGGGLRSIVRSVWLGTNTPTEKQVTERDDPKQKRLFAVVGATALAVFSFGCAGVPREAVAFRSLETIQTVVDRAEKIYGRECALGHIAEKDQSYVDHRIEEFHAAFLLAVDIASADFSMPASPDLDRLAESLVSLIETFAKEPAP